MVSPVSTRPEEPKSAPPGKEPAGVTLRAIVLGLLITALIDLWIHYAELVLGGMRGHTALANTSIPVGAFDVLFALVILNFGLRKISPRLQLSSTELLTIYVMCAVSTVLSSSGGLHFLIPTITAAHYFAAANPESGWAGLFLRFVPKWIAQSNPDALKAFYAGGAHLNLHLWAKQLVVWSGFLIVFACTTLCLTMILRKQWIDREHLPFPTVALPLELAKEGTPILGNRLFWIGTVLTFTIAVWNTLSLNYPAMPHINLRATDLSSTFANPPWNAVGYLPVTFFPFAIGIGYLLSTEVVFSCWFFYLFSKAEAIFGSVSGLSTGPAAGLQSAFPWPSYQCAGAFLGLAGATLWAARSHIRSVFTAAFASKLSADAEAREYRNAVLGLIFGMLGLLTFAVISGAALPVAFVFMALVLAYLVAATRIRAETGNAWPVGPEVDAFRLLIMVGGSGAFRTSDLTALTYVRAATAQQDFRGVCMPHELDGFKIGDSGGIKPGKLAGAMVIAVTFGVVVSFIIALFVWTKYGALAKTDTWRSMMGKTSFDRLATWLKVPQPPDTGGMTGFSIGVIFTLFLAYMRMRYVWWPFHPVGYCMSNTATAYNIWMPFFIAWLAKVCITRAGGMKLYRQMMPLFFGFIAGDFLGGGLTTLIGCFTNISVWPTNW